MTIFRQLGQKDHIQFIHAQVPVLDSALLGETLNFKQCPRAAAYQRS